MLIINDLGWILTCQLCQSPKTMNPLHYPFLITLFFSLVFPFFPLPGPFFIYLLKHMIVLDHFGYCVVGFLGISGGGAAGVYNGLCFPPKRVQTHKVCDLLCFQQPEAFNFNFFTHIATKGTTLENSLSFFPSSPLWFF